MLSTQLNTTNSVGLTQSEAQFKNTDQQFQSNENAQISTQSPFEQLKHINVDNMIDYGNPEGMD